MLFMHIIKKQFLIEAQIQLKMVQAELHFVFLIRVSLFFSSR